MSLSQFGESEIIRLPIFPLPNVVFFPNTILPLHIFESRYRQMVGDAMDSDRLIGMVLLKQNLENPEVKGGDSFEVGGMGRITRCQEQEDGKYDILLTGRSRFRILKFERMAPYRIARVQLLEEHDPAPAVVDEVTPRLIAAFKETIHRQAADFDFNLLDELDFATLVNSICSSLDIDDHSKQELLEMNDLGERARNLLTILSHLLLRKRMVSRFDHLRPRDPSVN